MSDKIKQTHAMLAKHHRHGEEFALRMQESFAIRFNEDFWQLWASKIMPDLPEHPVVLDLGTGPATFIKTLVQRYSNIQAFGVECAPYMLQSIGKLPEGAHIIDADLQNPQLPLNDASVDVATCSAVIHEMHQPVRMFQELSRVLKPGARFYIFDWVRAPLQAYLDREGVNPFAGDMNLQSLEDIFIHFIEHNRFTVDDLKFMLQQTGYRIIDSGFRNNGQHAWLLAEKN